MKQKIIYGVTVLAVTGCVVAGTAAIHTAAKPMPEAFAASQINPDNIEKQLDALEAIEQNELTGELIYDPGDELGTIIHYVDQDNNIYTYSEDGQLIGLKKFANQTNDSLPDLDEEQLRENARLYLAGLVDEPERYKLTRFEWNSDHTKLYASWNAYSGEVSTTDIVGVTMNKKGT